jgi:hypothetical protein
MDLPAGFFENSRIAEIPKKLPDRAGRSAHDAYGNRDEGRDEPQSPLSPRHRQQDV